MLLFRQRYLHGKALFLKVADSEFIGERQKVVNAVLNVVIFEMIHKMSTVSFHLQWDRAVSKEKRNRKRNIVKM